MTYLQGKRAVIAALVTACAVTFAGAAALSNALGKQPVTVAKDTQEGPVNSVGPSLPSNTVSGCWEVAVTGDDLTAHWVAACDLTGQATLGDQPWPNGRLQLPAAAGAELLMARADVHATLSEELAQQGTGALLFLPVSASGAGYYVAAWTRTSDDEHADGAEVATRGIKVGRYGVAPSSVVTPAGRVYLSADFSPRRAPLPGAGEDLAPPSAPTATEAAGPATASTEQVGLGRLPAAEPEQHAGQHEQQ